MKIKMQSLSKRFADERYVLKNLDFDDDIHTLAIIGSSGSGKSTLLRILGGLLSPTAGEVYVAGERISRNEADLVRYRSQIGFVFQQGGLFRHLSALENISLPLLKVHHYDKSQARETAMALLKRFGLEHDGNKKPSELSGGQQQRIAIARAVAPKPKLLLLDEPTSALDPEYTNEVLDIVDELKKDGLDFIIVTHEMGFARHACDKVAFLHDGRLIEYGESSELFAHPKTTELGRFLSKLLEWNV